MYIIGIPEVHMFGEVKRFEYIVTVVFMKKYLEILIKLT